MTEFHHVSVLLNECIDGLNIKPDGIYVDGTLGGAGHSSQIAARLTTGRLIGIDRDPVALKAAGERLAPYADRITLVHSNFCDVAQVLKDLNISGVDGILFNPIGRVKEHCATYEITRIEELLAFLPGCGIILEKSGKEVPL